MAFNLPVQNFFSRTIEPSPWVRPADWPVITDAPNEVQFLMSDINDASCTIRTQFTRTSGSQNIVIDWGDGTTTTVTTTAQTDSTKTYTPGTGTPCSRGYTTFKIRVYFTGTGVSVLSVCRLFSILLPGNTANPFTNVGLLEMYYGDGTQTVSMNAYYQSSNTGGLSNFNFLEYAKLPATITWNIATSLFDSCNALAVVIMPTSASALTAVTSMFNGCVNLRSITFPSNATVISSINNTFNGCLKLTSITLPASMNSCTNFNTAFTNCISLKNISIPSINSVSSFISTFSTCYSLEWVRFTNLPTFGTLTSVNCTQMFQNCYNLQNVYFPSTCSSNANYAFISSFTGCINLKSIVFPIGFSPNSISGAFNTCTNLKRVIFQSSAPNLTDLFTTFSNCINLTDVTLPSSISSSGATLQSTFNNCYSLKSLTIPNTYLITAFDSAFSTCYSLQTLTWTPGAQNLLTSLSQTFFGCTLLSSITLPTSMNALTNLNNAFNGCRSITTLTFPSSLNAVVSMGSTFNNCNLLTSVTLPASMSSCTTFSSTFNGCSSIQTITMPNIVSTATTTFLQAFSNCSSLRVVTLPGAAQLSSVNSISTMFSGCSNLTTINNFDKIGSLTATPLVNAGGNSFMRISSISFVMPLSQLGLQNTSANQNNGVQAVRLLNTSAGQWTGTSPQINVSYTTMSTSALVQLFNDMAAQPSVVSKTINITGATGAAGLTAADRLIVTSKGWTIIG